MISFCNLSMGNAGFVWFTPLTRSFRLDSWWLPENPRTCFWLNFLVSLDDHHNRLEIDVFSVFLIFSKFLYFSIFDFLVIFEHRDISIFWFYEKYKNVTFGLINFQKTSFHNKLSLLFLSGPHIFQHLNRLFIFINFLALQMKWTWMK